MSRDVVLVLATARQTLPAGTKFAGQYVFSVGDSVPTQAVNAKTATFAQLAPGDYTATAQSLDDTGAAFGPVMSAQFTVPVDGADQWDAPASLTVTIGDAAA
jgi:hypothetical protein